MFAHSVIQIIIIGNKYKGKITFSLFFNHFSYRQAVFFLSFFAKNLENLTACPI
ncbi:hypothetical protein X875_90 [Mannheimia varigena USDA-ARS-USMARC-1388]|nr:hypothetical protein X875_90 [Mannheimia varigena USDA-ARS-USMARC-1388]